MRIGQLRAVLLVACALVSGWAILGPVIGLRASESVAVRTSSPAPPSLGAASGGTPPGTAEGTATPSLSQPPSLEASPGAAASPPTSTLPSAPQASQPNPGAATAPPPAPVPPPAPNPNPQPGLPVRAAFYYPWFPETWGDPADPYTVYSPTLGSYRSDDPGVVASHVDAMQYGGIQVGIASWWGQGTPTDQRLPLLLSVAADTAFWWAIYHEQEGSSDPSVQQISDDLRYLAANHATEPRFFAIDGRFVVFVYGDAADGCGMVDRWTAANQNVGAYLVLKVFPGYGGCPNQPDGWHQYGPARPADAQPGFSYTISPGFHKADEGAPRLARDLNRWNQGIREMIASGAPFQLVTTFNEWGEGTAIEPAAEWASASGYGRYLDALHLNGQPP